MVGSVVYSTPGSPLRAMKVAEEMMEQTVWQDRNHKAELQGLRCRQAQARDALRWSNRLLQPALRYNATILALCTHAFSARLGHKYGSIKGSPMGALKL